MNTVVDRFGKLLSLLNFSPQFCEFVVLFALVWRLQFSGVCYRQTVEHGRPLNNFSGSCQGVLTQPDMGRI